MSPEMLESAQGSGSPRFDSDMWALCCTLWEMLTGGHMPFGDYGVYKLMKFVAIEREAPDRGRILPFIAAQIPDVISGMYVVFGKEEPESPGLVPSARWMQAILEQALARLEQNAH